MSAWKKPSRSAWLQEQLQHPRAQHRRSWPAASMRRHRPARSLDPAQRHHLAARQEPDGFGTRKPSSLAVLAANSAAARFPAAGPARPSPRLRNARSHPSGAGGGSGGQRLDHPGGEIEGVDVLAEGALDPRAQHLDRHLLARVGQPRPVDLRDRGGGDGFGKLGEKPGRPARSSSASIIALAVSVGKGGSLSCRYAQLQRQLVAHHIGAGRQDLAELDVGRAQRRQRPGGGRQGGDRPSGPAT
jgi:hypothetical protein